MNLRSFKLNRVYLDLLNTPNAGDFSWSWILKDFTQVQKEEGKFVVVYISTSSIKRQIRRFHVVVVQWTSKESTKKRDERTELLAWSLNLLLFWSRRCGRRRSCFWLLNFLVRNLPWTQLLLTYWGDLEQVFYKKKISSSYDYFFLRFSRIFIGQMESLRHRIFQNCLLPDCNRHPFRIPSIAKCIPFDWLLVNALSLKYDSFMS